MADHLEVSRIEQLATDLGRLRRMNGGNFILDSLCDQVESMDAIVRPTAAELYRQGWGILEALAHIDREAAECRRRLGR